MRIDLNDKEITLIQKSLVNLAKKEGNEFYNIIRLLNKLISAESKGLYSIIKEDIPDKTIKRVEKDTYLKDNGMMIAEYIKELHNLKGEARYVGNNKYRIGDYILKLESQVTKIDTANNSMIDIVNYRINGNSIGNIVVTSKLGKIINIETI